MCSATQETISLERLTSTGGVYPLLKFSSWSEEMTEPKSPNTLPNKHSALPKFGTFYTTSNRDDLFLALHKFLATQKITPTLLSDRIGFKYTFQDDDSFAVIGCKIKSCCEHEGKAVKLVRLWCIEGNKYAFARWFKQAWKALLINFNDAC